MLAIQEKSMPLHDIRSAYLPYCIRRVRRGEYVILNREYKPLGQTTMDFARYEPHAVKIKGIGPATARRLSARGDPDVKSIYLYNDGCIPTSSVLGGRAYYKRLDILARLQIGTGN
jgi:hypothetical protein